jgi:hypothetical protein
MSVPGSSVRSAVALLFISLLTVGCAKSYPIAGAPAPAPDSDPGSVFTQDVPLRVESRSSFDLVLSVERAGFRTRIGRISGPGTRDMLIPKRIFEIMTPIRLVAEVVGTQDGDGRSTIQSSTFVVRPGQRISWTVAAVGGSAVSVY